MDVPQQRTEYQNQHLHFRALRIVHRDETSTFDELLLKDESITVHHKNLHTLAIELYKVINGLGLTFLTHIFPTHPNLNSSNLSANTRSRSSFYTTDNPRDSTKSWSQNMAYIAR